MIINEDNYVEKAQAVIEKLASATVEQKNGRIVKKGMLTTSQIRNQLAVSADIYNEIMNDAVDAGDRLTPEICGRINYLKVRFIYDAGRDQSRKVKEFVEAAELLRILDSIQGSRKNFILFNRYMEALVAFHRYFGGKD